MAKVTLITEHFQHFVAELQDSFWGDLQGRVQQAAQNFFQQLSERQRDLYMVSRRYQRSQPRQDYRNGYYWRRFVTRFGVLRLRVARSRKRGFLPEVISKFQRRAEEVTLLIREAFLRGISTRQVGRVVATWSGETVSPQTVSRITRSLDEVVRQFHQARLSDQYAYLFLDGVSLRMRRPSSAGLSAQPGREPGRLGGLAGRSVPPGTAGQPVAADRHRRLSRTGGRDPDGLSARGSSALLGA